MAAWRRGNEAPMQWEFTNQPTTSSTISTPQEQAQQQQQQPQPDPTAPPPSDSPIEDESMRDASMLSPQDEDVDAASLSSTPAQALVRRNRRGSSSSIVSIRRSDEPHTSSLSSSSQHHQHQQWPLAPVVGTVINYLVPPLPQKDSTTDSVASLRRPPRQPSPSASSSAQQRAHATLHPREKPLLLLSYAQLTFNASLLLIALYVVFALVYTIRLDVVERLSEIEESYHAGIATCRRSYELNCLSVPLPPALVAACDEWKNCANKRLTDVLGGSRLRVVIEVLSEAWEAGVAGLGWRTLAFSLLVLSLVIGGTNSTLTSWRLGVLKSSRKERRAERSRRQQQMQAPTITGGSGDEDDSFAAGSGGASSNTYALPPPPSMQAYPASYPTSPNGLHPAYHHQQYLAAQYHHAAGAYGNPYAAQQHYMASSSPPPSPLRKQASNVSLLSAGSAGSAGSGGAGGGGGGRSGKGKRRKGWMSGMLGRKSSSRRARLGADNSGQSARMMNAQPSRGGTSSGGEWIDE